MPTISIKPVIYAQYKRADGSYAVRLRVTFARKSRFVSTNVTLAPSQLTKGLKPKDPAAVRTLDELVRDLRERAAQLSFGQLQVMDVDEVVAYLTRGGDDEFRLDFPAFARAEIARMGAGAKNYASALNSLCAYLGREAFDVSLLTSPLLKGWEDWLADRHGRGARALSLYTQAIAKLHATARFRFNDEEAGRVVIRNPFVKYKCPTQSQGTHRNAPPALLQAMLLYRGTLTGRERLGVDVFLLSFGLMGANAPDLMEGRIAGDVLSYNRRKTRDRRADNAEMRVRIEPELAGIVREYLAPDGRAFTFARRYSDYMQFGRAVDIGLHAFEKRLGLGFPLTLYVARHTWATVARSSVCNIDKGVVNDCICHVDAGTRVTDIYAAKDWRVMWEANRKVVRLFAW